MKNKDIIYAKQAARMYSHAYKPSANVWQFMKSIIGAFIYGTSTPSDYMPYKRQSK
jgi:hypothetical protein